METGACSFLCDAAWKEGQLLRGSGLFPKVVQLSEKRDSPSFFPSLLKGEESLLLPEIMLLPLLHTHAWGRGDTCPQGYAPLGESSTLLPQFLFQETNPSWNSFGSIPSLQHEEHTRGKSPTLPAASFQLQPLTCPSKHRSPASSPGRHDHGFTHPWKYPCRIPSPHLLPSPKNAKA